MYTKNHSSKFGSLHEVLSLLILSQGDGLWVMLQESNVTFITMIRTSGVHTCITPEHLFISRRCSLKWMQVVFRCLTISLIENCDF